MARSLNNPPSVAGRLLAQPRIRFPASPSRALTPRAWGQLPPDPVLRRSRRFTPTRVGTTSVRRTPAPGATVHPHACGDNSICAAISHCVTRFTPTRVGTTAPPRAGPTGTPVHPHACGDNALLRGRSPENVRSPPRVWGQRHGPNRVPGTGRFTPTRVGTTPSRRVPGRAGPVHPHACGDNGRCVAQPCDASGSPPRVWGQRQHVQAVPERVWFTPTRVGTTVADPGCLRHRAVHPHACGDNGRAPHPEPHRRGSPPRVWGQRNAAANHTRS